MKSLPEIASLLRKRLKENKMSQRELGEEAGIARRTLTHVLSGEADYKVTTLLSVLDRLGCELVIVPKGAAAGIANESTFEPSAPSVKSVVDAALERMKSTRTGNRARHYSVGPSMPFAKTTKKDET